MCNHGEHETISFLISAGGINSHVSVAAHHCMGGDALWPIRRTDELVRQRPEVPKLGDIRSSV